MTEMPVPDDKYMSGVYYDPTVEDFYTFERDETEREVDLYNAFTDKYVESLTYERFVGLQQNLRLVSEEAVENPVAYFEDWVQHQYWNATMDVGFQFADKMTTVVEDNDEDDDEEQPTNGTVVKTKWVDDRTMLAYVEEDGVSWVETYEFQSKERLGDDDA